MKYLIALAVLALAACTCRAETVATTPNEVGGQIELTDARGNCPQGQTMLFSRSRTGEFITGCWKYFDGKVFAFYDNGSSHIYNVQGFKFTPYAERTYKLGARQ